MKKLSDVEREESRKHRKEWEQNRYLSRRDEFRKKQREYEHTHLLHSALRKAKVRAKKFLVPFAITVNDIVIPEYCPVLGIPIFRIDGKYSDNSPSIDRLIPSLGYTRNNIRIISYRANRLKGDGTAEEHRHIAEWMEKERGKESEKMGTSGSERN